MADHINVAARNHNDSTFRSYSSTQALEYAKRRGGYPEQLIKEIINLHTSTGGTFGTLLDLGCGPGSATRDVAAFFDHAIGIDPSGEMITAAKAVGGSSRQGPIKFIQGEAELCDGVPDGSVDLITAATSAHWFDMDAFWPAAARILRPGGTAVFFTIWRTWAHPVKMPRAEEVHEVFAELEQGEAGLGPYQRPGNWSLMGLYKDLKMPWQLESPRSEFPREEYRRRVWNEDGRQSEYGSFLCGERWYSLDEFEKSIATISAATRWREAHPDIANTDKDVIKVAFKRIKDFLQPNGVEELCMVGPTVMVSMKRR